MICEFYFTLRCNSSCEFCGNWCDETLLSFNETPAGELDAFFSDLKLLGVRTVVFTGGEPLLRSDLPNALKLALSSGLKTKLFTNGILYPQRQAELAGLIGELYVSLDAPLQSEHDRIRGQECFAEALHSLDAAAKKGQRTVMNFTMTRDSIAYLPDMVELAEKLRVKIRINPVYDFFGTEGFERESIEYIKRYLKNRSVILSRTMLEILRKKGNDIKSPVCGALDNIITVLPDLSLVLPCFRLRQAYVPTLGKVSSVLNSDMVKGYKKLKGRTPECSGCMRWEYLCPGEKQGFLQRLTSAFK